MAVVAFTDFNESGNYNISSLFYVKHVNNLIITGTIKLDVDYGANKFFYITVGKKGPADGITEFGLFDGYGVAITTAATGSGKYNLFVIDSSLVTDEFIAAEDFTFVDVSNAGVIAAAQVDLLRLVDYDFQMLIGVNNELEFRIVPTGDAMPGSPTIESGTRTLSSTGSYFGYSAPKTEGAVFYAKNLIIDRDAADYAYQVFKFKPWSDITNTGMIITIKASGTGYDPTNPLPGIDLGLIKSNGNVDATVLGNINVSALTTVTKEIYAADVAGYLYQPDILVDQKYIYIILKTKGTQHASVTTDNAILNVDYISVTSLLSEQIHVGGKQDIYVWAPSKIVEKSYEISQMSANPYYIYHDVTADINEFPILNYDLISAGTVVDKALYRLSSRYPKYRLSIYEEFELTVDDTLLASPPVDFTLVYDTYNVETINNALIQDETRLAAIDNIVKFIAPYKISFEKLDYSGTISVADLIVILTDKFNNEWLDLSAQKLIQLMQENGAYYVDPDIRITIDALNWDGGRVYQENYLLDYNVLTPNRLQHLYLSPKSFVGITKL